MHELEDGRTPAAEDAIDPAALGHPRGTLVIVAIFALLFALGWFGLYVLRFLGHGAPHGH